jgi:hypothetical protein
MRLEDGAQRHRTGEGAMPASNRDDFVGLLDGLLS